MSYADTLNRSPLVLLSRLPWVLLLLILGVGLFGVLMLFSATSTNPVEAGLPYRQALRLGVAFLLLLGLALLPIRLWAAVAYPAYGIALVMLIGVELFGATGGGAQRWLDVGPIRLQPSEFMKLALVLALARYYHGIFGGSKRRLLHHVPAIVMIILPVGLVFHQPDLGTALLLVASGGAIIFFAGLNWRIIISSIVAAAIGAPLAYFYVLKDYQKARILTALDPSSDPLGAGYQIQQAKIAIGSGGLDGRGYLQGVQSQLDYIPEQHTDFIFTVIAEELGFIGASGLLAVWGVIFVLGLAIAFRSKHVFGKLAAAGAVVTIAFYVVINIGMVTGMLPVVGVPLPLISYGGTAMLTVMAAFGLVACVHSERDRILTLHGLV